MILIDTSVWILHFRQSSPELTRLLNEGDVLCHEFVIGELACGNLKNRKEILNLLQTLPKTQSTSFEETLFFIERKNLTGTGIGFIDAHLLASAQLSKSKLWSLDKMLQQAALKLHLNYHG